MSVIYTIKLISVFTYFVRSFCGITGDRPSLLMNDANSEYNCMNWNVTFFIDGDSNKKQVLVTFKIFEEYEKCFSKFEVYLYKLWSSKFDSCDLFKGTRISMAFISEFANKIGTVEFKDDIRTGNYCAMILPCYKNECYDHWSLHSPVVFIDVLEINIDTYTNSVHITRPTSEIVAIILICLLTTCCGICMYWKYVMRKIENIRISSEVEIQEFEEGPLISYQAIDVYILFSECDETRRKVGLLKDFLVNVAKFNVILIEDIIEEILIDPISWLNKTLSYKCSKLNRYCNSNKRFIIVQTEAVLHYIKYKMDHLSMDKMENSLSSSYNDLDCTNETNQEMWFHYALNVISIDWKKGLKDYCHLFVVCFDDALCYGNDQDISLVHNVRYTIPDHLVKLCSDLNAIYDNAAMKEKLAIQLKNYPISHL